MKPFDKFAVTAFGRLNQKAAALGFYVKLLRPNIESFLQELSVFSRRAKLLQNDELAVAIFGLQDQKTTSLKFMRSSSAEHPTFYAVVVILQLRSVRRPNFYKMHCLGSQNEWIAKIFGNVATCIIYCGKKEIFCGKDLPKLLFANKMILASCRTR